MTQLRGGPMSSGFHLPRPISIRAGVRPCRAGFPRGMFLPALVIALLAMLLLPASRPLQASPAPSSGASSAELARYFPARFPAPASGGALSPLSPGAGADDLIPLGVWPFGPAFYTDYDEDRDLLFYGTGAAVRILDLSDPSNPALVSDALHGRGRVRAITYESERELLFLAEEESGMEIWDVSDPVSPVWLSTTPVVVNDYVAPVLDVEVADGFAYIAAGYGFFHVFDVLDPENPGFVQGWQILNAQEVVIRGSRLVVIGDDVALFDVLGPGQLDPVTVNSAVNARGGTVLGTYAYVVRNGSIIVLDLSVLFLPVVGNYQDPDIYLSDVVHEGPYLYTSGSDGIRVLELSDPTAPAAAGMHARGAGVLEAEGDRLYATRGSYAFWMDLTDPIDPAELGEDEAPA
ncbi:MAG: hypothetical protein GF355_09740, partial [Candidatus Eisenbacteria bacterium]|nr:hypothetical protein [Candidatus Eisenbacteria bacterium]